MKDEKLHVQKEQQDIKKKLESFSKKARKNVSIDSDKDYRARKEQYSDIALLNILKTFLKEKLSTKYYENNKLTYKSKSLQSYY